MQVSIVQSTTLKDTKSYRIDAEYYHPVAVSYEKKIINNLHGQSLKAFGCRVVSGPFGSSLKSEAYLSSGVPFIRISALRDFLISDEQLIYISESDNRRLSSSQLNVGDIVLSKVGNTIGIASIVTDDIGRCNISENNIGIRMPIGMSIEDKSFLVTYLNSIPGQNQILRAISGNAQPKLNVADIEEIKVPHFSNILGSAIHNCLRNSNLRLTESKNRFKEAQITLLSELGLTHWQPKHQLTFIKNYSDTQQAKRIDAEYFQPKYDEIINAIKNYSGGWNVLDNFIDSYSTGYPFSSKSYVDNGICLIRINNILKGQLDLSSAEKIPLKDLELSKKDIALENDILISMSGTIGNACKIPQGVKAVINQRIFKFTPKNYKFDVLTLIINSDIGLQQLLRIGTGGVQTNISGNDIKKIVIPILSEAKQLEIQQKVTESFKLRQQSKHLLECAKQAVEMAIEQDEQTALNWLEAHTQLMDMDDGKGV